MKKLTILFLCMPLACYCQEESTTSKFQVGYMIAPEMTGIVLREPADQEKTISKAGFSTGLNLEFGLRERISLRTGLGFGYKRFGHNHEGLIFSSDIDPQLGIISESRLEESYLYYEVQLPLIFQYDILVDRFFVAFGTDLVYATSGESEQVVYFGDGVVERTPIPTEKKFNAAIVLSTGYTFYVAHNLNLVLEPTFRYNLSPYLMDMSVIYNLGLKTTLNVAF